LEAWLIFNHNSLEDATPDKKRHINNSSLIIVYILG